MKNINRISKKGSGGFGKNNVVKQVQPIYVLMSPFGFGNNASQNMMLSNMINQFNHENPLASVTQNIPQMSQERFLSCYPIATLLQFYVLIFNNAYVIIT